MRVERSDTAGICVETATVWRPAKCWQSLFPTGPMGLSASLAGTALRRTDPIPKPRANRFAAAVFKRYYFYCHLHCQPPQMPKAGDRETAWRRDYKTAYATPGKRPRTGGSVLDFKLVSGGKTVGFRLAYGGTRLTRVGMMVRESQAVVVGLEGSRHILTPMARQTTSKRSV